MVKSLSHLVKAEPLQGSGEGVGVSPKSETDDGREEMTKRVELHDMVRVRA